MKFQLFHGVLKRQIGMELNQFGEILKNILRSLSFLPTLKHSLISSDQEHPPTSLKALRELIMQFWSTKVTPQYCRTVIRNAINNIQKSHDGLNHEKDTATDLLYQK